MNFMKLNSYLDGLAECGIPACDLAVTYRGESVYRYFAGYADIEKSAQCQKMIFTLFFPSPRLPLVLLQCNW